jgi:hypothetical protein
VHAGAASQPDPAQRRANRRWGARSMTAVGGRPIVTYWILAITSAVSLLQ